MGVAILTDGLHAVLYSTSTYRTFGPVVCDNGTRLQRLLDIAEEHNLDLRLLTFKEIDRLATDVEQAILDEDLAHELAEAARRFMRQANCTPGVALPHAWDDLGCTPSPAVVERAYDLLRSVA